MTSRDAASSHFHLPYDALATEEIPRHTSSPRAQQSYLSRSFALQCLLPPLLGLSFVAFGLYVAYTPNPIVISRSTDNTIALSQAFTALFAVWHFLALLPVLDVVRSVRSEEWWRRLLHSTTFNRANAVSSNIGGNLAHGLDILGPWSSYYYQAAWILAILAVILADIAPGAIHVEVGWEGVAAEYMIPALPPGSIFSNFSRAFYETSDFIHASIDIAPMYYTSLLVASSYVTAGPPVPNALVPRPAVTSGVGYRYSTDVAFLNYECAWSAPQVAEPDTIPSLDAHNLSITVEGIQGTGWAPIQANGVYLLEILRNATTKQPSFAGHIIFIASSGTPYPNYGFLNLSSVPTYALSPAWTAAAAAYRANNTGIFSPPQYLSAAVCVPNYTIESWKVQMAGSTIQLLERRAERVGNLDALQLQLAIQDSFGMLQEAAPIRSIFGFSIVSFGTLFDSLYPFTIGTPKSDKNLSVIINEAAIPSLAQAYLDGFPFGNVTIPGTEHLHAALVLVAQRDFIYATAGLYVLLALVSVYLFARGPAPALDISQVLEATQELGHAGNDTEKESRVRHVLGNSTVAVQERRGFPTLTLHTSTQVFTPNAARERIDNLRVSHGWMVTPALGAGLVALGLDVYLHPRALASATASRATLYAAMFTWGIGLWRSASLVGISALLRRANSDEWSRYLRRHQGLDISRRRLALLNTMSTNRSSLLETFRSTWLARTSTAYKICYITALVVSLCAVVSQGAVTLLTLPALTTESLPIPIVRFANPVEIPWSADTVIGPFNDGLIETADLGMSYVYLEQVVGAVVLEGMPKGFIIPVRGMTNATYGSQYPTDVAHIECNCSWVPPALPQATANVSYIPVVLDEMDIQGIQTVPNGIAITTGLFAWTLWGGGPGDPVNLNAVPSVEISPEWQQLIAEQYAPAYFAEYDGRGAYSTNLTRVSTLVCEPVITIMPKTARALAGITELSPPPSEFSGGVGNLDKGYVAYMTYAWAVQQAQDLTGVFRPNLLFGLALGNAVLQADPLNTSNGTIPRSNEDIAMTMISYMGSASKSWIAMSANPNTTMNVDLQVIKQSLVIAAGLPQLIITAVLYVLLVLAGFLVSRRAPAVPFTLSGILMLHSKLTKLTITDGDDEELKVTEKGED
ncbi:hypothetical protein HWV62_14012 [Athelia sp. TMB]|nr:hypothetical protein HWV62_14012 [Athelia sp. TMB]